MENNLEQREKFIISISQTLIEAEKYREIVKELEKNIEPSAYMQMREKFSYSKVSAFIADLQTIRENLTR